MLHWGLQLNNIFSVWKNNSFTSPPINHKLLEIFRQNIWMFSPFVVSPKNKAWCVQQESSFRTFLDVSLVNTQNFCNFLTSYKWLKRCKGVNYISLAITSLKDCWFIPWLVNPDLKFSKQLLSLFQPLCTLQVGWQNINKKLVAYNFMHYILLHFSIVSFQEIQNERGYGPCNTCEGSRAMSRKTIHKYRMNSLDTLKKNPFFFCNLWSLCNKDFNLLRPILLLPYLLILPFTS